LPRTRVRFGRPEHKPCAGYPRLPAAICKDVDGTRNSSPLDLRQL